MENMIFLFIIRVRNIITIVIIGSSVNLYYNYKVIL